MRIFILHVKREGTEVRNVQCVFSSIALGVGYIDELGTCVKKVDGGPDTINTVIQVGSSVKDVQLIDGETVEVNL